MPSERLEKWIRDSKMNWRHVYDGKGFKSPLATAFHVRGIPSLYLLGRDGQIAAMGGECRGDNLKKTIARILE
mgnify:CR=1 FL=1